MIPPKAASLLIDYFDSIDVALSRRLIRDRPWSEISLTSLLCDLMDAKTQEEERLVYPLAKLNADLASGDGILDFEIRIDTHEYPPEVERYVTQSDLGLVVNYEDRLLHETQEAYWLFQAKRLEPTLGSDPMWTVKSRFGSRSKPQHRRIQELNKLVGANFVKYLLYTPRPATLAPVTTKSLAHLRSKNLAGHIFDYALGIKLHDELAKPDSSIAAGIFVAASTETPGTLARVHQNIFTSYTPFSWFIAEHFSRTPFHSKPLFEQAAGIDSDDEEGMEHNATEEWRRGIVTGDRKIIKRVLDRFGEKAIAGFSGQFLPAHTMTVKMRVAKDFDVDLIEALQE